jgi:hypothetical protein
MFQMLLWDRCEKGHDLHPGAHSSLNTGTCVLENKAIFWCDAQALGGLQKALRVRLTVTDLVDRHNYLRERQTCS